MAKKKMEPVHPGEILMEDFLRPMNLSQNELARNLGVPPVVSTRSYSASAD